MEKDTFRGERIMSSKNANATLTFDTNKKNEVARHKATKRGGGGEITRILSGRALRRLNARRVAKGKEVVGYE